MTLFAPCVSVQLMPTAAAKLLQLLAFPSHALEKQAEQSTRRLSMRLLLKGRDGAHFLAHSSAWIHHQQAIKQRKLFRGHEEKTEWLKAVGRWRMQKQVQFQMQSAQVYDTIHEMWAAETHLGRVLLCLWSDSLAEGNKATWVTDTLPRWLPATWTACTEAERKRERSERF